MFQTNRDELLHGFTEVLQRKPNVNMLQSNMVYYDVQLLASYSLQSMYKGGEEVDDLMNIFMRL